MKAIIKTHVAAVVDVDEKERTVKAVITTDDVDSDKEVVLTKGLNFERFQKNPVVLFMHDAKAPIGTSLWQKGCRRKVEAKTRFATTELGDEILKLYAEGILKGWSIGMDPSSMKMRDIEESDIRKRAEWAGAKRIIESAEIVEYSAVSIPANADALNRAYGKGLISLTKDYFPGPDVMRIGDPRLRVSKMVTIPLSPARVEPVAVKAKPRIRIAAPTANEKLYTEAEVKEFVKNRLDFIRGVT